jgi:hypothetical protein
MNSCAVCCDVFTKKVRHEIVCLHCKGSTCQKCFCNYLLTEGTSQVCMLCHQEINAEFIYLHTSSVFRDKYFNSVAVKVLNAEKILLKYTKEHLLSIERAKLLDSRISNLTKHLLKYPKDDIVKKLLVDSRIDLNLCLNTIEQSDAEISQTSKTYFCPVPNCEGLVSKGVCMECGSNLCGKCHEPLLPPSTEHEDGEVPAGLPGHVCDPNVLETLKLLKRDTKPCPRCKVPIHKIEGCDQMFCVKCNTAFSWRTGKIENGVIHNPHYFQWLRTQTGPAGGDIPRQPGDDPCEEELRSATRTIFGNSEDNIFLKRNEVCKRIVRTDFIPKVLREVNVVITRMAAAVHEPATMDASKRKLRVNFLKTENNLKESIKMQDKEDNRHNREEHERVYKKKLEGKIEQNEQKWFKALRLLLRKQEMNKDVLNLLQTFERGLKDAIVLAHRNKNLDVLEETIYSLHDYFQDQVIENKKRHGVSPSISIVIPRGLDSSWLDGPPYYTIAYQRDNLRGVLQRERQRQEDDLARTRGLNNW